MIHAEHLICDFPDGEGRCLRALSVPEFQLEDGAACALIGPSGSGKSTFFHCLSGLLRPTEGRITVDGTELSGLTADGLSRWHADHVGYIFQEALLLPYLTVMENILLAAEFAGKNRKEKQEEAEAWLEKLGMKGYGRRMPSHLSGGEKQRAGFIRAILTAPSLLLADEPTASLDAANSRLLMESLLAYQRESGCTLLCATHDPAVQELFPRRFYLRKEAAE